MKNKIGVIGLGVVGANLARNFASKEIRTALFNRTYERTNKLLQTHGNDFMEGFQDLTDFIYSLETPRRIVLTVQAGAAVDEVLCHLYGLLQPGDYVIDCGNSFYFDTERRHREAKEKKVNFLGMGISGGADGALLGPSLMPGLSQSDWDYFKQIFDLIAAKDFEGNPCVTPIGPGGAGHFVKMVHNGIEYAIMQLIAEIYDFNRRALNLSPDKIAGIFEQLNSGDSSSFLTEITTDVLRHPDKITGKPIVDVILDRAAQKNTGGWTAIESIKTGAAAEMVGEAVAARSLSSYKGLRVKLSRLCPLTPDKTVTAPDWDQVLTAGMLMAYAQGIFLIRLASEANQWDIDLAEVLRIWQGGSIIRAKLLFELRRGYLDKPDLEHLLEDPEISSMAHRTVKFLSSFIVESTRAGIATPVAGSAYNYWLQLHTENSPANLIQGLRDFFGAHTFERVDQEGLFHENWQN